MWLLIEMQHVQQLHERKTLMIDLNEYEELSHSNVDLFQYFQLMKRVSTILSLIRMLLDQSFASSDFNEYFFIECDLSRFDEKMLKSWKENIRKKQMWWVIHKYL